MTEFYDIENIAPWAYLTPIASADAGDAVQTNITTSAVIITPGANVRSVLIVADKGIRVNPRGGAAVNDATCILIPANQHTTIDTVPGTAVYALSLSGTAAVTATPMTRKRITGKALGAFMHPRAVVKVDAEVVTP